MTSPRVLVVDDEADLRELLEITLGRMGLDVDTAGSLTEARQCLLQASYALVLTDMRLPDGLGIELVAEVSHQSKHLPIAVITAFGSADNAVVALKAGAFDYLSKPVALDQLRRMVRSALRVDQMQQEVEPVTGAFASVKLGLNGRSQRMQLVCDQIRRVALSMAPVAISGESGTGKELAARDIHALSSRADKPFIAINCGAIPEALMEAEFFGYRKGAFTGASDDREGLFQAANGGTLLLDEVADLPLVMQVKLLRAIQERRVRKVGATTEEPVDVRLISATHQDLDQCVAQGKFRQDLYYRLAVIELHMPPLRDRQEDVELLSNIVLQRLSTSGGVATLTVEALQALRGYSFPGNVRELENILERAVAFANDGVIDVNDLVFRSASSMLMRAAMPELIPVSDTLSAAPNTVLPSSGLFEHAELSASLLQGVQAATLDESELPESLPAHLDQVEREIICRALAKTKFNRTQAAQLLGISFRQLRYRMQRLAVHEPN